MRAVFTSHKVYLTWAVCLSLDSLHGVHDARYRVQLFYNRYLHCQRPTKKPSAI